MTHGVARRQTQPGARRFNLRRRRRIACNHVVLLVEFAAHLTSTCLFLSARLPAKLLPLDNHCIERSDVTDSYQIIMTSRLTVELSPLVSEFVERFDVDILIIDWVSQ